MDSKLINQLAKHIREIYFGVNWTWSNLKDQLSDVTWEEANRKVYSLNTILALTYHIQYYIPPLVSVIKGGPLTGKDKFSFDHPTIQSKEEWDNFVTNIFEEAEALAGLIERLDEDILWEIFSEEKYGNYFRNIQGFVEHAHYHLGQIVVIKKILRNERIINDE